MKKYGIISDFEDIMITIDEVKLPDASAGL
jgi:hypothetical protein